MSEQKPVNNLPFTISALARLEAFIASEQVQKLEYFSDYDLQAVKDAQLYLRRTAALEQEAEAAIKYVNAVRDAVQTLHSVTVHGKELHAYHEARGKRIDLEMKE